MLSFWAICLRRWCVAFRREMPHRVIPSERSESDGAAAMKSGYRWRCVLLFVPRSCRILWSARYDGARHSSLFTLHSSPVAPHSSLFTFHFSLFTRRSSLFTIHFSLFTFYAVFFLGELWGWGKYVEIAQYTTIKRVKTVGFSYKLEIYKKIIKKHLHF